MEDFMTANPSSPAVTEFRYHPSERAAEVFARDLAHRGVQQVVVYLGPDDSTIPAAVVVSGTESEETL
jgi:hypothetical protein